MLSLQCVEKCPELGFYLSIYDNSCK